MLNIIEAMDNNGRMKRDDIQFLATKLNKSFIDEINSILENGNKKESCKIIKIKITD